MNRSKLIVAALACTSLWGCSPAASPRDASAAETPHVLEGAWHATRVDVEAGVNLGVHTVDVQPAIYVFSKDHYAITAVNGYEARPYLSEQPTDEEKGRASAPFTGSAGTYASDTGKLTLTPQVTKDPAGMVSAVQTNYDLLWVDDKVWLTTSTPEDGRVRTELTRLDNSVVPVSADAEKLRGVWRRSEMIVGAREDAGRHVSDMQPGYYIFAPPYFSGNFVSAFAPRPVLGDQPTDADMGRAFSPFASFAGTYTLTSNELVFRPLVTMNPNNMRGRPFQTIRTQWEGDDIWLIYTGVDGTQNRVRLTRVKE
jgi:hypothetical protein